VTVIIGEKRLHHTARAEHGKAYTAANIETNIEGFIDHLDKRFPLIEFQMVELLPNKFNFIAVGARSNQPAVPGVIDGKQAGADVSNSETVQRDDAPEAAIAAACDAHDVPAGHGEDGLDRDDGVPADGPQASGVHRDADATRSE
jgi:hypothetical protein